MAPFGAHCADNTACAVNTASRCRANMAYTRQSRRERTWHIQDSQGQSEYGTYTTVKTRANITHTRQSRPDSVLGLQEKVLTIFYVVRSSLESRWISSCWLLARQRVNTWPWPTTHTSFATWQGCRVGGLRVGVQRLEFMVWC